MSGLETKRFVLRDFEPADVAALAAYQADPRFVSARRKAGQAAGDPAELVALFRQWAAENPRKNHQFAVICRKTGRLVGCAGCARRIVHRTVANSESNSLPTSGDVMAALPRSQAHCSISASQSSAWWKFSATPLLKIIRRPGSPRFWAHSRKPSKQPQSKVRKAVQRLFDGGSRTRHGGHGMDRVRGLVQSGCRVINAWLAQLNRDMRPPKAVPRAARNPCIEDGITKASRWPCQRVSRHLA